MTQENKNIASTTPELRFKEFQEDWKVVELNSIANKVTEKNRNENIKFVLSNSAIQGIVSQESYFDKEIANENNLGNYYIVNTDDFVYNPRISNSAPVGPIKRNHQKKGVMSPLYSVFRFREGNINFIERYFETTLWHTYLKSIANFGARHDRMNISAEKFYKMPIPFPSISEQEKIVGIFLLIDKKIQTIKLKKSLLEKYKKGLIQKIFSQEILFKDANGKDFPKWNKVTLNDILIERNEKTTHSNQYQILSSTSKGMYLQSDYFNKNIASENNTGYKIIKKNDVVFSPQNLWLGNINVNTLFDIGIVSPSYKVFSFHNSSPLFYYYFLLLPKMISEYEKSSEQGASVVRRNLNMNLFLNIEINVPSLSEQEKIAGFFIKIDKKIILLDNEIDRLEKWKKGLLQKMFA